MSLPIISQKIHRTKLLSSGKEVKFRPMTVKNQKDILLVKETAKTEIEIYKAIVDVIQSLVEEINLMDLYVVDFEKLVYDIRTISDGTKVDFNYKCTKEGCGNNNQFQIDIQENINVINVDNFESDIEIKSEKLIVKLRQIKLKDLFEISSKGLNSTDLESLEAILYCVSSIVKGEEVYSNFTREEIVQFVDSLPSIYLTKLIKFYEKAPTLSCDKTYNCTSCGNEIKVTKNDLNFFF